MPKFLTLSLGLLLFAGADIPGSEGLRSSPMPSGTFSSTDAIAVLPDDLAGEHQAAQSDASNKAKAATLQERSKLELIRYVSGEFAKATRNLPAGKEGFLLYVGKPLSPELLERAVATHGAAVHIGDNAQITKLEFRDHAIVVDVNGGGRGKRRWRDHIQFGMGGTIPTARTTTTTPDQESGPPGLQPGTGSTIFLEFSKAVPDLTPGVEADSFPLFGFCEAALRFGAVGRYFAAGDEEGDSGAATHCGHGPRRSCRSDWETGA